MRRWVIDRVEGDWAVCYDGRTKTDIPLSQLPEGALPGVTVLEEDGVYRIDRADTEARHTRIQDKFARLRRRQEGTIMHQYTTTREKAWYTPEALSIAPTATLAPDHPEQTWMGFGGCFNELGQQAVLSLHPEVRAELLDNLFSKDADGLRFDFCRLPVGANDYAESWYSLNENEGDYAMEHFSIDRDQKWLIPYIREGLKRNPGMKLFASPWSPPTWMKYPKAYNHGTLVWTEQNLKAYALYLMKFVQAYEAEGIHIHQLHVQNEPVSDQKFPSCIWTGKQFAEFIGKYLGPLFEANGITTEIWLGTINAPEVDRRSLYTRYNDYAGLVLHDPEAARYVKGVAYQWCGKYAVKVTHESFPELPLIQSENECGDGRNTWEYARYIFELFRTYITDGVSAYVYWNMALPPMGLSTWGWPQNAMVTTENGDAAYNPEYYVMKHFARFVVPGARRIALRGSFTGCSAAFENPDGSHVLISHNPFDRPMAFTYKGETLTLPPDSFNTFVF